MTARFWAVSLCRGLGGCHPEGGYAGGSRAAKRFASIVLRCLLPGSVPRFAFRPTAPFVDLVPLSI